MFSKNSFTTRRYKVGWALFSFFSNIFAFIVSLLAIKSFVTLIFVFFSTLSFFEFIYIKSNFLIQLKFVKRKKKPIFDQLKIKKNALNVIIVNNNKKFVSKLKFIHQIKFIFSIHFKNSINIINLTIVESKLIKKRWKTIIATHFILIFISSCFFKTISSNLSLLRFRYIIRIIILIVDHAFKLKSNFNNI